MAPNIMSSPGSPVCYTPWRAQASVSPTKEDSLTINWLFCPCENEKNYKPIEGPETQDHRSETLSLLSHGKHSPPPCVS